MKKKVTKIWGVGLTLVLATTLLLFSAPVSAQSTINVPGDFETIQLAIDTASPGDTINVATGVYTEDLEIDATKIGLELVGNDATIKGVAMTPADEFPTVAPNINILADGVSINGFTIQGPDVTAGFYSSGICIGGSNVEISDNEFEVTNTADETGGDIGQAIQTYNKLAIPEVDISGLSIHDNTFNSFGEGIVGYEGIYINRDAGVGSISITDNDFTGVIFRAITTERSNATIAGNALEATGWAWTGVLVMDVGSGEAIDSVSVTNNDIEGFGNSVKIGDSGHTHVLTNIDVSGNTFDGIVLVRASAEGITVADNSLGSVTNTDDAELDAQNNWWGQSSGFGDAIDGNVDAEPWLLAEFGPHYDYTRPLPAGWSIISPDAELESWAVGDAGMMYAYDGGGFVTSFTLDPITPMFVKTEAGGGIGFNYAEDSQGIFTTDLEAGWNLIGVPETDADVEAILSPIRLGANNEVALATLVCQGDYNIDSESFYESMLDLECWVPDLYPFDGYWAYMNVAKEFGVVVVD